MACKSRTALQLLAFLIDHYFKQCCNTRQLNKNGKGVVLLRNQLRNKCYFCEIVIHDKSLYSIGYNIQGVS